MEYGRRGFDRKVQLARAGCVARSVKSIGGGTRPPPRLGCPLAAASPARITVARNTAPDGIRWLVLPGTKNN